MFKPLALLGLISAAGALPTSTALAEAPILLARQMVREAPLRSATPQTQVQRAGPDERDAPTRGSEIAPDEELIVRGRHLPEAAR